ncbi:cardiolipin synthase [Oscillibacter sp.]|uniref:cardiolipin synthase n=1 Tax=Oscillibacter sp. TaxID=1945593 RepID=UPI002606A7DF|nr:cardiolipin synthase [Oscillibacter sp.]MDD3346927.1 cardiolipin synthase [Oscillibacter sp.]
MHKNLPQPTERIERRISAATSISMCVLTVLAQIATTLLLTYFLREKASYVYAILEFAGAIVAIRVYQRPGSPSYKLAWMCLLLALPVSGMILFCLWGGTHQAKSLSLLKISPTPERESQRMGSEANLSRLNHQSPAWGRVATYLQKRGFPLCRNTDAKYFGDGAAFFDDLIQHLSQAEVYIFLEYYILAEGRVWDRMFAVLRERAAAGVEVRIIFDDFGNLTRLSDDTLQKMQNAGIEVEVFNPVHRYVNRIYFNYRDHRKIAVIDGQFAYTGGINVADEYANLIVRFGHWKDSAVRVEGEGAWGFATQFMQMWKMMGRTLQNEDDYYRPRHEAPAAAGFCQPFTDGPLNNPDNPIEETYLQMIGSAKRMLYLTTPYYAVEESMQKALCIAADSGVDVRLLIPGTPDHKLTYLVAETYWGELLRHGVKIYKYTPGFLHAKSVMVDREAALIGSTNMDYRTFQLHYECGVMLYHMPVVEELLEDLDSIMAQSALYTLEEWNDRSWFRRSFASILRLGAVWI